MITFSKCTRLTFAAPLLLMEWSPGSLAVGGARQRKRRNKLKMIVLTKVTDMDRIEGKRKPIREKHHE